MPREHIITKHRLNCALAFLPAEAPILPMGFLALAQTALCFGNLLRCKIAVCLVGLFILLGFAVKYLRLMLPLFMMMLLLSLSVFMATARADEIVTLDGQTVTGIAVITDDAVALDDSYSHTAKVNSSYNGNFRVTLYTDRALTCGNAYRVRLELYKPLNSYGKGNGVFLSAQALSITETGQTVWYLKAAAAVRQWVRRQFTQRLVKDESATLLALTIGDKSLLSDQMADAVKYSGVSHVMVVSGMHLSVLMGGLLFLLRPFRRQPFLLLLLTLVLLFGISAVCGFTKSILRAGCTYAIAAVAPFFKRTAKPIASLSLAVTALLIAEPYTILSISFRLSVFSTFGILVVLPFLFKSSTEPMPPLLKKLTAPLLTVIFGSLAALWITLPTSVRIFGYISKTAVLTNLCISTAVTVDLLLALLALLLCAVPLLRVFSSAFFYLAGAVTKYINHIVLRLGTENAVQPVNAPSALLLTVLSAVLLLLTIFITTQGFYLRHLLRIQNGYQAKRPSPKR